MKCGFPNNLIVKDDNDDDVYRPPAGVDITKALSSNCVLGGKCAACKHFVRRDGEEQCTFLGEKVESDSDEWDVAAGDAPIPEQTPRKISEYGTIARQPVEFVEKVVERGAAMEFDYDDKEKKKKNVEEMK